MPLRTPIAGAIDGGTHERPEQVPSRLAGPDAAASTGLVDLLGRLGAPLGSGPLRYVRDRLKLYGIDTTHFVDDALPERQKRSYTRELLEEAAAHAHSIREMLEYMNVPPEDGPYGYIRKRLDRLGIDTSHFTNGRRYGSPLAPRHELTSAVAKSKSLAGVLKLLGQTNNGAARARLKRSLAEYGLSTAHFTGQGHTRGSSSLTARPHPRSFSAGSPAPHVPEPRSCAVHSLRSDARACVPRVASGTPGRASVSCWRSITSAVTIWTIAARTCATCVRHVTVRPQPSQSGEGPPSTVVKRGPVPQQARGRRLRTGVSWVQIPPGPQAR